MFWACISSSLPLTARFKIKALRSISGSLAMFTAMLIASQAVRRGDYVGYRGECGSARLALETTWAVLARRAARGSTYRKATCGAAFRLRLSVTPFKVADPRISPL
jgi:hypothetical protein